MMLCRPGLNVKMLWGLRLPGPIFESMSTRYLQRYIAQSALIMAIHETILLDSLCWKIIIPIPLSTCDIRLVLTLL